MTRAVGHKLVVKPSGFAGAELVSGGSGKHGLDARADFSGRESLEVVRKREHQCNDGGIAKAAKQGLRQRSRKFEGHGNFTRQNDDEGKHSD